MRSLALALPMLLLAAPAGAVTIFGTIEGTVTTVGLPTYDETSTVSGDPPPSFVVPGDAISITFQFDSDAVDKIPSPIRPDRGNGKYDVSEARAQAGSYVTDLHTGGNGILVRDRDGFQDQYILSASFSGPILDGYFLETWHMSLLDSTGTVFSDDSLPTDLSLSDFDSNSLRLYFRTPDAPLTEPLVVRVEGSVSAMTFVPEPGTIGLLALVLAGVATRAAITSRARPQ